MAMSFSYEGTMTEEVCAACVSVHHGSRELTVDTDLTSLLGRGEHLVVAGAHSEVYRVHAAPAVFSATSLPLTEPLWALMFPVLHFTKWIHLQELSQ